MAQTVPEKNVVPGIGWTPDSMHYYLAQLLQGTEKYFNERIIAVKEQILGLKELVMEKFDAQDEAVTKANIANEKHFDSINELQGTMKNLQDTFIPRKEVEGHFNALIARIEEKDKTLTAKIEAQTKSITEKIDRLYVDLAEVKAADKITQSKGEGAKNLWIIIVGVISVLSMLVAIFTRFIK